MASIRGLTDKELSEAFGVKRDTVRKKRLRDAEWMAAIGGKKPVNVPREKPCVPAPVPESTKFLKTIVEENLESIAANNPIILARYLTGKIRETVRKDLISAPTTIQELQIADKLVRTQTGQDKENAQVSINLWGGGVSVGADLRDAGNG